MDNRRAVQRARKGDVDNRERRFQQPQQVAQQPQQVVQQPPQVANRGIWGEVVDRANTPQNIPPPPYPGYAVAIQPPNRVINPPMPIPVPPPPVLPPMPNPLPQEPNERRVIMRPSNRIENPPPPRIIYR